MWKRCNSSALATEFCFLLWPISIYSTFIWGSFRYLIRYLVIRSHKDIEAARFRIVWLLWNLTAPLLRHLWNYKAVFQLTHWGWVTHTCICIGKVTIIGSDNGLSPSRRQAIIGTNSGILLIAPLGTNFSEISIGIQTFSFKKRHLKKSSEKWQSFCLGLNV